jgi:two-component system nitrogen regulation sensor histidine kinase NtrY
VNNTIGALNSILQSTLSQQAFWQAQQSETLKNVFQQLLEQAFINIIKNAIEAIGSNGKIRISSNLNERTLVICDTGEGITQEQGENMFSAFYSTKKDGHGIGLTTVREILLNHNFQFSLKTVAEHQTEFRIVV